MLDLLSSTAKAAASLNWEESMVEMRIGAMVGYLR